MKRKGNEYVKSKSWERPIDYHNAGGEKIILVKKWGFNSFGQCSWSKTWPWMERAPGGLGFFSCRKSCPRLLFWRNIFSKRQQSVLRCEKKRKCCCYRHKKWGLRYACYWRRWLWSNGFVNWAGVGRQIISSIIGALTKSSTNSHSRD